MIGLDVARGAALVATAIVVGAVVFRERAWLPALASSGSVEDAAPADELLARVVCGVAVAGCLASLAALALEDDPTTLQSVTWGAAAAAWLVLGLAALRRRAPRALVAVCLGVLVFVPGLSGNAARESAAALVVAANATHVLSAGAWAGGIACLLVLVNWAARAGAPGTRVATAAVAAERFSAVALVAVVTLTISGVLQGIALVGRVEALVTTGYGRLVTAKAALLCLLALAGVLHRGRTLPDLDSAARDGAGAPAALDALRRLLRVEVVLLVVVFTLTSVLAGTAPPSSSNEPARATAPFGSGELQVVARPGHPGANDLRIEVPRSAGGAALVVVARQRRLGLGPVARRAARAAPGAYRVSGMPLDAPGTWELTVSGSGGARATVRLRLR